MELYRNGLKLTATIGLDESRGSVNVTVRLLHNENDEYLNYTEQIHIRYLFDNQVKEEILPTNDNGFYIPGKPLSYDGPIELAVHLINGDIELVTNELSFVVKDAPNGTTQVDPSEFTWQQLVDQYVNAKLDTFANKLDLSKFEEKVNGSIENQNQNIESFKTDVNANLSNQDKKITDLQVSTKSTLDSQNTKINDASSTQNSKIATLESRMNTFTSLEEGSTTGDAELQDIRVGANGTTYDTAGNAVRGQYSQLKEDLVNDYYNNNYQFVVGGLSITNGSLEPDVTWAISTSNLISFKENTIIECSDNRYLFHVYYYSSDGTFVKRLTDLKKAEILVGDFIKLSLIHSDFSHDSLDLSAKDAIKISLSTIDNSLKYDNIGLNEIKFTHCNYDNTGLTKESLQHRLSTNIFKLKEDVILTSPSSMFFKVFLFNDDNSLKSIIDNTKSVYIPRNNKIRIMYIRDDNNQDTSYLDFSTLSQIEIRPIYFVLNNEYKPLNGYWFWGNTTVYGVYESNVKWRFTNVRPIQVDSTIEIKKIDGYIIDLRIFKGDNQVRFDSTNLHEKIYIYPNEIAYINILRDDKNVDNSLLDTDVLTKVMCKAYNADEPSKDMYEYYGNDKNDNILKLNKISSIDANTHSQSVCVDTDNDIIYNFGGENYGYKIYNLNGILIDTKDKVVTGHDNDCVKVNDDFYFTSGENNYITKWNIKTNTSTRIDVQGIENNGNENTIRRISGICVHNSDENELILTTIDLNTTNELINTAGDKVSIYMLNLRDNTAHLLKEFDKDVVYVQGCTMYNDMLYIMCNIQTTDTPSNYKGINIKCINLFNKKLIDEINIYGIFENEGLDFAVENNTVYLYTIISHFGVFENLVKFKAPLIN